jgi:hypothetical protein
VPLSAAFLEVSPLSVHTLDIHAASGSPSSLGRVKAACIIWSRFHLSKAGAAAHLMMVVTLGTSPSFLASRRVAGRSVPSLDLTV